jgi:hypothetical protein
MIPAQLNDRLLTSPWLSHRVFFSELVRRSQIVEDTKENDGARLGELATFMGKQFLSLFFPLLGYDMQSSPLSLFLRAISHSC